MYRDDNEALYQRLQQTEREAGALRQQNDAIVHQMQAQQFLMRQQAMMPYFDAYRMDVMAMPPANRAALALHSIKAFPVWAAGLLHFFTLGLWSLIHFGMLHDRLPRGAHNDPSGGKAIGFAFIPYFNLYWYFFSNIRLCDRLNLQYRVRGLPPRAPRGLTIAAAITWVIPYLNLLIGIPIMGTILACVLQARVNEVARLDPHQWAGDQQLAPAVTPAGIAPPPPSV